MTCLQLGKTQIELLLCYIDMFDTPESVLYAILGVILVENLFEVYLSSRQCKVYRTALVVPPALKVRLFYSRL